jgi:hypothetical protein
MMWGWDAGGGWLMMGIGMLVWLALTALVVWLVVRVAGTAPTAVDLNPRKTFCAVDTRPARSMLRSTNSDCRSFGSGRSAGALRGERPKSLGPSRPYPDSGKLGHIWSASRA